MPHKFSLTALCPSDTLAPPGARYRRFKTRDPAQYRTGDTLYGGTVVAVHAGGHAAHSLTHANTYIPAHAITHSLAHSRTCAITYSLARSARAPLWLTILRPYRQWAVGCDEWLAPRGQAGTTHYTKPPRTTHCTKPLDTTHCTKPPRTHTCRPADWLAD